MAASPTGFTKVAFEITPNMVFEGDEAVVEEAAPVVEFDANATYHAYLGVQSNIWSFRNAFDEPTYGMGTDYFNQITGWDADNNAITMAGTFTDAEIKGDGTYTVKLDGPDFGAAESMNLIFVSTDIPLSSGITITDVNVKLNGSTKYTFDTAVQNPDSLVYINFMQQNIWNADVTDLFPVVFPISTLEVEFTVAGFGYEKEATEVVADDAAPAEEVVADEDGGSNMGLIIGIVAAAVVVCGVVVFVVVSKKKKAK